MLPTHPNRRRREMGLDETGASTIMRVQDQLGGACMVDQERWAEIRRLFHEERVSISEIGRRLDLDRKTVRRSVRQTTWQPYRRVAVAETLLTAHADFVRARAPQVNYSARILYQELRASRSYTGSYETVKRCVAPLREVQMQAERALLRFETPPGQQSQIDWGQALVPFRAGASVVHVFVLTLGFSRRGFYYACADERLAQFLEAHERAFTHSAGIPGSICMTGRGQSAMRMTPDGASGIRPSKRLPTTGASSRGCVGPT